MGSSFAATACTLTACTGHVLLAISESPDGMRMTITSQVDAKELDALIARKDYLVKNFLLRATMLPANTLRERLERAFDR